MNKLTDSLLEERGARYYFMLSLMFHMLSEKLGLHIHVFYILAHVNRTWRFTACFNTKHN